MNIRYCLFALLLVCQTVVAQERFVSDKPQDPQSPIAFPKKAWNIIDETRSPLQLPAVDGYTVLKCDFHMHTVFSDGYVWPTTRVEEAYREGLDLIAITEHLEFHHLNEPDVNAKDLNREYEIAKKSADMLGIMVVRGAEVTREVPAGHFNVIFLNDANLLEKFINYDNRRDTLTLAETLQGAKEQGAFIFWNHPAYQHPKGIAEWFPVHEKLYNDGLIMGVEVANSNRYIPIVHKWAEDKGLTMFSNSDAHNSLRFETGVYRPMTLVFAKDRTIESVHEAIIAKRTVAFAQNFLYGEESLTEPLFVNSIKCRCLSSTEDQTIVEITNHSGLNFEVELLENDSFTPRSSVINLFGGKTISVVLSNRDEKTHPSGEISVRVNNIHTSAALPLESVVVY